MTQSAVAFRNVGKNYPHFALGDLNFDLPQGHIMGLIGPNGAGKSTTIRILMGLVHQDRGSVEVLGHAMPDRQIAAKRDIGFVSEDLRLFGQATLEWHMHFLQPIYPGWDAAYAQDLARRFDLNTAQRIREFSHGQQVKAALLLVLARRPRLLVLDEPTTGLDPVARHEVLDEMMEILADEDRTILFSSHDTRDVENLSDQITFIDRGRIIESRDKETFLDSWRRIRLEAPRHLSLPDLPGTVSVKRSDQLVTITTRMFTPAMAESYSQAGIRVQKVETMTLEEIFVANVRKAREELIA